MSELWAIRQTCQQLAGVISSALNVEAEIVDDELRIVAGVGKDAVRVGEYRENGDRNAGYLYGRVLNTLRPEIVEEPASDPTYDPSVLEGKTEELAEICCPVVLEGKALGVLAMAAMTPRQRATLMEHPQEMLAFLGKVADLLASKVSDVRHHSLLQVQSLRLEAMVDVLAEGVIAVDDRAILTHCNRAARRILRLEEDPVALPLESIWPGAPLLKLLKGEPGYREHEEFYPTPRGQVHLLVSAVPLAVAGTILGVVASFRDMRDVRRFVYNMSQPYEPCSFDDIIGHSEALARVKEQALRAAAGSANVLITGESGTGKELFARAIHFSGPRRKGPFVAVNCGAIPESLLESELFGYEGGAFTGARKEGKAGKFELADGGTIFLDEVGDLPLHMQVKLLHVLQNRCLERVGGTRPLPVDVRVIAATNRDLETMLRHKEFREDLYFRLNVIPLHVPPLRERREDIPCLVEYFATRHADRLHRPRYRVSPETLQLLEGYDWPGNVRELENAIEYAINMEPREVITPHSLPLRLREHASHGSRPAPGRLREELERVELELVRQALRLYPEENLESRQKAAALLGISEATLYRKIQRYGLGSTPARRYRAGSVS
ncbi:MAG TPA: sigma 54-interacting transcriptional regulator [Firmicutes bacterium]|nr:sigma 54-interacting transcriptional regulator [Bacillota bacterium]